MPPREPTTNEKRIIDDVLLYQLKPSETAYSHYTPQSVFHDPVSIAKGLDSIKSQFNGMPKLFAESITQKCDLLADSPRNALVLNLTQPYVFKSRIPLKSKGRRRLNSKVTLHLDQDGLITKHDEEWDHKENLEGVDGFMGKLMAPRKKTDAKLVEKAMPSNPSMV